MAGGAVVIAKRAARLMLVVTMIQIVTQAASPAAAETLIVQGSTTFNRRIMEPFHPQIEAAAGHVLTIIPNKSTPGLIGLLEGRAHLSMISAPLRTEIEILRQTAPGAAYEKLREFNISKTQIAIGVHQSNPVRKASAETVAKILQGGIRNWRELGGPDLPIRVVLVGGGGGVTAVVESELLHGQKLGSPSPIFVKTPVQLVQVIEQERGALGFAQLALVRQRGIPELVTDKPLQQTLSLVTLGNPTPAMQAVIDATRLVAQRMM
jgi:phosphate transport system substrate-binding protein